MCRTTIEETSTIIILTEQAFREVVLRSKIPVVVVIGADWCGSCHIMEPMIEQLSLEYARQIKFARMDIDANEAIAREYGVTDLPFLLFFKGGRLVDHIVGMISRDTLETRLKALL
jgi:thioredoxin 1